MILMKENFFPSDTNAYLQEKKGAHAKIQQ